MTKLFNNLKAFIYKIQNSSDSVKKFWLITLSAVTIAIVLGLWVIYIKATVAMVEPNETAMAKVVAASENETGFFKTLSAGWQSITAQIKDKIATPKTWSLDTNERNFILETVEPITKTELP